MAKEVPEGAQAWPKGAEASRRTGYSRRQLDRWVNEGLIRSCTVEGTKRYDPADLEELPQRDTQQAELIRAANEMVQTQAQHIAALYQQVPKTLELLLRTLREEHEGMRARVTTLESTHHQAFELVEQVLSQQAEREAAAKRDAENAQRKQEAFAWLRSDVVPKILNQRAVGKLVESLEEAQMQALLESGFLTEEQTKLVRALLAKQERANGAVKQN